LEAETVMKKTLVALSLPVALAVLIALPVAASAQKPVTRTDVVTVKATIEAIDHDTRMITLKEKDGYTETVYAGPEVRRFDELKVGDQVTFKVTESIALHIRKPGEPAQASSSDDPAIVRANGAKPGGTITQQDTVTVKVKTIDPKTGAVTVLTDNGGTMSFKVEDKKILKGINAGDRVVINYTTALVISVE
jgi:Cu/Ag efflux protein CusF